MPVKYPASEAAVKVPFASKPVPVLDAKAESGAKAAPTDAEGFRRVSARTNNGNAFRRYSPSSTSNVTITTVLLSLLCLLIRAAAANAQDVIVLLKLGAVAEKIGKIAVELRSAQYPMVFPLIINDTIHNNWHHSLTNTLARHSFKKKTNHLVSTWIDKNNQLTITLSRHRDKRFPILAAVGKAIKVSA